VDSFLLIAIAAGCKWETSQIAIGAVGLFFITPSELVNKTTTLIAYFCFRGFQGYVS
tara:strand:- start:60 stop:230 length:171 start_codon:yes stop_codon:yes gene_type:complete